MALRLPWDARFWSKYAAELVIVAAGVALGLWATEWAADRRAKAEVQDAYVALHDELTDNYEVIGFRLRAEPCVSARVAELRQWAERQRGGERTALPAQIGRPASYTILDSVWDVSKAGQVASKMPLEERRRYAAVYDVLESFAGHQRAERDVWFDINDYAGLSQLSQGELARFNGLVERAAALGDSLSTGKYRTLFKDLALLGVNAPAELPADQPSGKTLCTPLARLANSSAR
jgi:hypothetical protein